MNAKSAEGQWDHFERYSEAGNTITASYFKEAASIQAEIAAAKALERIAAVLEQIYKNGVEINKGD